MWKFSIPLSILSFFKRNVFLPYTKTNVFQAGCSCIFCQETHGTLVLNIQLRLKIYLYVRLPARACSASRNSLNAFITSRVEYHRCDCGKGELVSWKENLLLCSMVSFCIWYWVLSELISNNGSQSGNLTMKSMLWSWKNWLGKRNKRTEK